MAPLFKMLEASFELIVPLVVASIIDDGIRNNNIKIVVSKALILVLLAVVGMVAAITAQFFAAKAATGFATEVRHSLFEKIQSFSFNEIDKVGTSTLITRISNDVNQAQNGVNMFLRLLLRSPFIVVGAFVMALTIDVKASMIFLAVITLLSLVVVTIMKLTVPRYRNDGMSFFGMQYRKRTRPAERPRSKIRYDVLCRNKRQRRKRRHKRIASRHPRRRGRESPRIQNGKRASRRRHKSRIRGGNV